MCDAESGDRRRELRTTPLLDDEKTCVLGFDSAQTFAAVSI